MIESERINGVEKVDVNNIFGLLFTGCPDYNKNERENVCVELNAPLNGTNA